METAPSGAMIVVEATMAPFMAISPARPAESRSSAPCAGYRPEKASFSARFSRSRCGIAQAAEERHGEAHDGAGQRRADPGAENAEARDKKRIENDIQPAHARVQKAGREHIAAAL